MIVKQVHQQAEPGLARRESRGATARSVERRSQAKPSDLMPWRRRIVAYVGRHPGAFLTIALSMGVIVGWIVKRK